MLRLTLSAAALFATAILPLAAQAAVEPVPTAASKAPLGSAANPILKDYPVPASQAYRLLPTDPDVVTNGPVPDTAANRARFGQPMSHAGRASEPDGN